MESGRRIAVIGAGISGLSAAWLLHRSGAHVTLFEKEATCGGHSLTDESPGFAVDLGFQVFNLTTYPHLVGLLEALGVDSEESEMSFALSVDGGAVEWASHGLGTVFAQRANLWKLSFWRMLADVIRFGREAPKVLLAQPGTDEEMTLGQYLQRHKYSQSFRDHYLLPMCAAVWSAPNSQIMRIPVRTLVQFWANHHLLDIFQRPVWRVVKDRSRSYVNAILAGLEDIWINSEVVSVAPGTPLSRPTVRLADGAERKFDAVVLATHSDTSLRLLGGGASQAIRDVLGAIPYGESDVWVHRDVGLMPTRREAWASWNLIGCSNAGPDAAVCVTYWLNRLQRLPPGAPDTFVTLNPAKPPNAKLVSRRLRMAHPILSAAGCAAQAKLPSLQGQDGLYFAGAWCGFGFHEDGLRAGVAVAQLLGAPLPWVPRPTSPKLGLADRAASAVFDRFARMALRRGRLRVILPNGRELCYGDGHRCGGATGEEWRRQPQLEACVRVYDCAFFRKIITRHDTGLGEAYMDGDFEVSGDLGSLLAVLTANAGDIQGSRSALSALNWVGDKLLLLSHLARPNTLSGSRKNIEQHYDAGNDMYRLFLDPTMTYSGAVHEEDAGMAAGDSLEQAQLRKLDSLIRLADLKPSDHVLEIGCGWGSLAIRAAQGVGCRWTGVTLSREQLAEAQRRVKAAGLGDRVTLLLCDYRDLPRGVTYDKVISCEMIEAVGREHLPLFFRAVGAALRAGGLAVMQAISEPDDRYEAYCRSSDFIREHIFPGGHLPCMSAMLDAARGGRLSLTASADIGRDYALTLRAWRAAWEARKDEALALGYSERFWRKYRFYFAYCEAAFDARYIHNWQLCWLKTGADSQAELVVADDSRLALGLGQDAVASGGRDPADPLTQILLAVYFFLAGVAVTQSARLWLVPLSSVVYLALFALTRLLVDGLCKSEIGFGSKLSAEGRAWLSVDAVHLAHSTAVAIGALAHAALNAGAWRLESGVRAVPHRLLPDLLVCTSAGFCGFQLFTLVHQRLFKRARRAVLDLTLALVLFGAAAYKGEQTPLLATMLVSEVATAIRLGGKMQAMSGVAPPSKARRRMLLVSELLATLLLSIVPHAFAGVCVLRSGRSFSSRGLFWAALLGSLYVVVADMRRTAALVRAAVAVKPHAA